MKRRQLLVGSSAVATTALAGCIGSAQTSGEGSTRTITVSNTGEETAEPDLAVLHVSVEATGDEAAAVRDDLAERSDRLYQGLVETGIADDRITTDQFRIDERIDRQRAEAADVAPGSEAALEAFRFYEGTHAYRVEITDIESVGSVVDTAVEAGADSVDRIEYTLSDAKRAELRDAALDSALAAARDEAEYVAGKVDASVREVKTVDTSGGRVSSVRREVAFEDAAASGRRTELQPDDVTVRTTVDVTYTIG